MAALLPDIPNSIVGTVGVGNGTETETEKVKSERCARPEQQSEESPRWILDLSRAQRSVKTS